MADGVRSNRTFQHDRVQRLRRCVHHFGMMLTVALGATNGWGQASSQTRAAAEVQFDEGLALMRAGNFVAACSKLENSQRVDPAVGTLLYLGECYVRLGKTASAWVSFREAASLAAASNQAERAALARSRATSIESQLSYLRLAIPAAVLEIPELRVRHNGDNVDPSLVGTNIPVDPGTARVEVSAPGYDPYTASISVAVGAHTAMEVPLLRRKVSAQQAEALNHTTPVAASGHPLQTVGANTQSMPDTPGHSQRLVAVVLGGAGLVGIGLGSYFGLSAISKNRSAESASCDDSVCQQASDLERVNSARRDATASNFALGIGTSLFAAGAILYWLAPSAAKSTVGLQSQFDKNAFQIGIRGRL